MKGSSCPLECTPAGAHSSGYFNMSQVSMLKVNEMDIMIMNTCLDLLQMVSDLHMRAATWLMMVLFIPSDASDTRRLHSSDIHLLTSTSVSKQMLTLDHHHANTDWLLGLFTTTRSSTVSGPNTTIFQGAIKNHPFLLIVALTICSK